MLCCDLEIGVDCALVTYSHLCIRQQGHRYARCAGAVSSCWDGSRGVVLKYALKQRLTHDFQLMTCVSTSGWLSLYALPFCHAVSERVGRV